MEDVITEIARAINPTWFDHDLMGLESSPLNNFPDQDKKYQEIARKEAERVYYLLLGMGLITREAVKAYNMRRIEESKKE